MPDEPATPEPGLIDALLTAALARVPVVMDDEGIARLREHIERLRLTAAALNDYHVGNADEPDTHFRAISGLDQE
jgi:hypothetical protein